MTSGIWSASAFESFLDPTVFDEPPTVFGSTGLVLLGATGTPDAQKFAAHPSAPSPAYSHTSLESDLSSCSSASSTSASPASSPTVSLFPLTTLPYPNPAILAQSQLYDASSGMLPFSISHSKPPPASVLVATPYTLPTSPKALSQRLLAPHEESQAKRLATLVSKSLRRSASSSAVEGSAAFAGGKTAKQRRNVSDSMRIATVKKRTPSKSAPTPVIVATVDPKQERLDWLAKLSAAEAAADRLSPASYSQSLANSQSR
ncbi:hypothetical protein OIV83_003945 [Microbotryomycetes sp. JL201]|nr:hypothetical protein OIV83_003945 [Microbotryomycetes sp. JL201]